MVPKLMDLTCHIILYLRNAPVRCIISFAIPHKFFPLISEILLLGLLLYQTHQLEGGDLVQRLTVGHDGRVSIESVFLLHGFFRLEKVLEKTKSFFWVVLDEDLNHFIFIFTHVSYLGIFLEDLINAFGQERFHWYFSLIQQLLSINRHLDFDRAILLRWNLSIIIEGIRFPFFGCWLKNVSVERIQLAFWNTFAQLTAQQGLDYLLRLACLLFLYTRTKVHSLTYRCVSGSGTLL